MIIPIRCFTCGKLIAHLWKLYESSLQEEYIKLISIYNDIISNDMKNTIENETLNKLNITRYCCRRMFISHVDLSEKI